MGDFCPPSILNKVNIQGLPDERLGSLAKKKYGSLLHFLNIFKKSWNLISEEWLNSSCWRLHFLGILIIVIFGKESYYSGKKNKKVKSLIFYHGQIAFELFL